MFEMAKRAALLALVGALGAAIAAVGRDEAERPPYRIGPKDLLEIRVFEEPKLNVERRVSVDGSINLPLLGEFPVLDLTEYEAAERLRQALERSYLQRASVTVQIKEFLSRPISVIGAVNKPGHLELSGSWTLLEAITEAGGLADNHGEVVHVLRRADNGLSDQLSIDLDELLVAGDRKVNIPIFANDLINVPAAVEVTVFCLGEVERPGALVFRSTERITLLSAVARAGGLTERASRRIAIKRRGAGGEATELAVSYKRILSGAEPDVELQDGDLIVVKESFF